MWLKMLIVFAGGGLGAIAREFSMREFGRFSAVFPLDIFAANVFASFLLGLVFGLHRDRRVSDKVVLLISTGFCGGMSTFSTFIYGAYSGMMTPGRFAVSLVYVAVSLVVGYGVTWLGLGAATRMRRR